MIETERLLLRKPTLADAIPALDLLTDPAAMAWLGGVHPDVAADPEFPVRRWLERWEDNGCGPFSVLRREDGRWLGRVGILVWDTRGDWTHSTFSTAGEFAQPELGWALASEHWGHGYATEAARAARDWAWSLGIERLISVIAPANARSQRVAERLGCTPGETVTLFDTGPAVLWEHPR